MPTTLTLLKTFNLSKVFLVSVANERMSKRRNEASRRSRFVQERRRVRRLRRSSDKGGDR